VQGLGDGYARLDVRALQTQMYTAVVKRTDTHRTIRPSFAKDACAIHTDVDESRGCTLGKRVPCFHAEHSARTERGVKASALTIVEENWSRPRHVPYHT
jgi:hypothetical protein